MLTSRNKRIPFGDDDSKVDLVDKIFQFMAGLAPTSQEWELLPSFMRCAAMVELDSKIAAKYQCADAYDAIKCLYNTDSSLHMHKMKKYSCLRVRL